jgi:hypothetical protein
VTRSIVSAGCSTSSREPIHVSDDAARARDASSGHYLNCGRWTTAGDAKTLHEASARNKLMLDESSYAFLERRPSEFRSFRDEVETQVREGLLR